VAAVAAAVIAWQMFAPPIVGMADQGDFRRIIGKFGYGPEQRDFNMYFVVPKYVPDLENRVRDWEQFSSEYGFVAAALVLNHIVSKDGALDIKVMGFVHALALIAALFRLLQVTRGSPPWGWIALAFVLTDVAYVAYLNTFFAEPASLIFFLLLFAESIQIVSKGMTRVALLRWSAWAVLFVLAKPANAFPGLLIGLFALTFLKASRVAWIGSAAIVGASVFMIATTPQEMKNANTYNLLFLSVIPESRNPAADLQALGLDWRLQDSSRTGAWSPDTRYPELETTGDIGAKVTQFRLLRFYLARPARFWRHIQAKLPTAMLMRPPYGNFEPDAGPPHLSRAFALWSDFHEHVLQRVAKWILFLLLAPAAVVAVQWRNKELWMEFLALLGLCTLVAFLTAIFGDSWDDIKHLFLFNLMLDALFVSSLALAVSWFSRRRVPKGMPDRSVENAAPALRRRLADRRK
jgi:hypothetical protein